MNQADMEQSLRALLADRAEHAPISDGLAEQIIVQAAAGPSAVRQLHRPTVRRRSWTLSVLVAAAVAAVLAGTIGYFAFSDNSSGKGKHPIAFNNHTPSPTQPASTALTTAPSTPAQSTQPVTPAANPAYVRLESTLDNGARRVELKAFKALDLTFVGSNIWAMGSATCFSPGVGRCSLLVHSTDGVHWSMLKPTPFNVADDDAGCAVWCVQHIRFATSKVGYLYGPSALLMTTDAGRTWKTQPGGALALETLDNNVIRVSGSEGCPPGCSYTVQTSAIGSTKWTTETLPGAASGAGVTLARTSHFAYLMTYGNPAGGAENEKSTLFVSDNDGVTWTNRGEVCGQNAGPQGEVDSSAMTGGSDASIQVVCQPHTTTPVDTAWVTISTDHGRTFHRSPGLLDAADPGLVGAATASQFCVQSSKQLSCTRDGGSTYAAANLSGKGPKHAVWLGFENQSDGRALEITGSTSTFSSNLWTTHNGGRTWTLTVGIG